jgi:transcriptional regulator with XRE-family HTH domain
MTNRAVGEAIGSTEHQVWRWRAGRVTPSTDNLAALANVLFDGDITELYADQPAAA